MTTPQSNTRRLAGLTGLALVAVIGVGSVAGSSSAANDLTPKAYEALVDKGLSSVKVDFDGREATLSNGTPDQLAEAEKIVEGVEGVRSASIAADRGSSMPEPPTFSITSTADGVNLTGVVPNAAVAEQLETVAREALGRTSGGLKVDRSVDTAEWLANASKLILAVEGVNDLSLSVDGDSLSLGGSMPKKSQIDGVIDLVEPTIGALRLDNTLEVDARSMSPEQADHIDEANVSFARGSAKLDAEGRRALTTLADVLLEVPGVELEIGGRAGSADPVRGKALSDRRVAVVKDFLVDRGVDASRLSTRSYGSDSETDGDALAEQDRRVDFIVKGK